MTNSTKFENARQHRGNLLHRKFRLASNLPSELLKILSKQGFQPGQIYPSFHVNSLKEEKDEDRYGLLQSWTPPSEEEYEPACGTYTDKSFCEILIRNGDLNEVWVAEEFLEIQID